MSALRPCPRCGHVDLTHAPALRGVYAVLCDARPRALTTREVADATGKSLQNAGLLLKRLQALGCSRSQPRAQESGGYEHVWIALDPGAAAATAIRPPIP